MRAVTSPRWTRCGSRWSTPSSSSSLSLSSLSSLRWSSPASSRSWSSTGRKWQGLGGLWKRLPGERGGTLPMYWKMGTLRFFWPMFRKILKSQKFRNMLLKFLVPRRKIDFSYGIVRYPEVRFLSFRTPCNGSDYDKCDCGSEIGHPEVASLVEQEKQKRRRLAHLTS